MLAVQRVLILPITTEIGLEVMESLRYIRWITCIGASSDEGILKTLICNEWVHLPSVEDPNFISELNRVVKEKSIDVIYPAHDEVIYFLSKNRSVIASKIVLADAETCEITRFKSKMYHHFSDCKEVRVPKVYGTQEAVSIYPVFIKPDRGQGGYMGEIINDEFALRKKSNNPEAMIICEYLPGEEYTVECFSTKNDGILYCNGRTRSKIRNGIAVSSTFIRDPKFLVIAKSIYAKISINGAWFFQLKRDSLGRLVLLEIAARIPGTSALSRVCGANLPLLTLYHFLKIPIQVIPEEINASIERTLANRYKHNISFARVYIDFDDTLIINGDINTLAIRFLYQCINASIPITLITRHKADINEILKRFRLYEIFDKIIHLRNNELKSDYIHEEDALFIDDSFKERNEVKSAKNLVTIDSTMIEMLINNRGI